MLKSDEIKIRLITKSFPFNLGSGYTLAENYAKENNLKLNTTLEQYTNIVNDWFNKYNRYPTDFMFVFEKII